MRDVQVSVYLPRDRRVRLKTWLAQREETLTSWFNRVVEETLEKLDLEDMKTEERGWLSREKARLVQE